MNKCVKPKWPWGLCFGLCQHWRMNVLSGLLISVTGLEWWRTADDGSSRRRWCASVQLRTVSLPCLTLSWGGGTSPMTTCRKTFSSVRVPVYFSPLGQAAFVTCRSVLKWQMRTELQAIVLRMLLQINSVRGSQRNSTFSLHTVYWKLKDSSKMWT